MLFSVDALSEALASSSSSSTPSRRIHFESGVSDYEVQRKPSDAIALQQLFRVESTAREQDSWCRKRLHGPFRVSLDGIIARQYPCSAERAAAESLQIGWSYSQHAGNNLAILLKRCFNSYDGVCEPDVESFQESTLSFCSHLNLEKCGSLFPQPVQYGHNSQENFTKANIFKLGDFSRRPIQRSGWMLGK
uniref:(northern house mosquito) hypothetical protein n=1 Tax=Culex pipiens TaxID=7175 RepID=A0A8D8B4K7_CULPI